MGDEADVAPTTEQSLAIEQDAKGAPDGWEPEGGGEDA